MARADDLFRRIADGETSEIERMIDEKVVEGLFLDYKQAATIDFRTLHADDRKNLAKAIAGFANSEGGIIVWGVDCRKTSNGDIPTGPKPISDPNAFKSLLDGATSGVTLPPHPGVESLAFRQADGTGFVVTHVPAGLNVPYRALVKNEGEYYIRAGSDFLQTPHAVLAGLFGKAPHPNLEIDVQYQNVELEAGSRDRFVMHLDVSLRNSGRGTATDVYFLCSWTCQPEARAEFQIAETEKWGRWGQKDETTETLTGVSESFYPLPPGAKYRVFTIVLRLPRHISKDVSFDLTFGASSGPGVARVFRFRAIELSAALEICRNIAGLGPDDRRRGGEAIAKTIDGLLRSTQ